MKVARHIWIFAFVLTYLSVSVSVSAGNDAERVLTFGVVPQQSASKLARLWTPILNYLGQKTGYQMRFKTAKNIPTFEERLAAGEYDLSYMNPYHYTVYHEKPGYIAFAKAKDKRIKGIIVVRKDSRYRDPAEFKGETLVFPSPAAFAASILPRGHLKNAGIPFTPKYVSSHDSVYRTVAKGMYPAGGGVIRTFKNVAHEVSAKLRILWTTKGYTPHAFAAHPRVPREALQRIQQAMVDMGKDPRGKALLVSIKLKGLVAAHNDDWDDVRTLGINLLDAPTTSH